MYRLSDTHYVCVDIDFQISYTTLYGKICALFTGDSTAILLALNL